MFKPLINNSKYSPIERKDIMESSLAANTRLSYSKSWSVFQQYCAKRRAKCLPAKSRTVCDFLIYLVRNKGVAISSLQIFYSAIGHYHRQAGHEAPNKDVEVVSTLRGLIRSNTHKTRRVKALQINHLRKIIALSPQENINVRDTALLVLGFSAALRRSEICNLKIEDIEFVKDNKMFININRSKTDPQVRGYKIPILNGANLATIDRVRAWIEVSEIKRGYLFQTVKRNGRPTGRPLHTDDIARLVKQYVDLIGLDARNFSGHSLRAGFITSAIKHNARLDKIMEISRHKNVSTMMQYVREGNAFKDHAGSKFL